MPFCLRDRDISSDVAAIGSALIVPCRFCPAASLAVREGKPYIELFRRFLRTPSYESYIQALKSRLEGEGIRTGVFDSKLPHQFVVCMWTAARRKKLARQAAGYDGVIVLGCDGAVAAIRSSLPSDSRVIAGTEAEGLMDVIPLFDSRSTYRSKSVTRLGRCSPIRYSGSVFADSRAPAAARAACTGREVSAEEAHRLLGGWPRRFDVGLRFDYSRTVETNHALEALAALAHATRLQVHRLLVEAGLQGLSAGRISEELDLPPATLSFHLAHLARAGLVTSRQEGRFVIYAADFQNMNALVGYLTENCCGGRSCGPLVRSRRRA